MSFIFLGGALGLAGTGCGGTKCGDGTVKQDGTCVPAGEQVTCATGTTLVGNECVPDGSVICEVGTTYDADTGTCVADITGCGPGTVVVDGECVTEYDSLVADIDEPAEPNSLGPGHMPGEFDMPAVGDNVTIKGCITPYDDSGDGNLDSDLDAYVFVATEPTLLDVTVAGFNGLAGGFLLISFDEELDDDDWIRFGVNLANATSSRQVYLPKAGAYALIVADSRSLFFGAPAGDDDTCYFTTVERLAVPSATPITAGTVGGDLGDTVFYSYDGEGIMISTLAAPSNAAAGSLTVLVNGAYYTSTPFDDLGDDALVLLSGLSGSDEVLLVVDHAINFSLDPVPYELEVSSGQEAPADGGTVTVDNGSFYSFLYFDVDAGDVVHLDYAATSPTELIFVDSNLLIIAQLCGGIFVPCSDYAGWFQFPEAGRYYLAVFDESDPQPASFDVTMSRIHVQPTTLEIGTPVTGADLSSAGASFHLLDATAADWLVYDGDPTGFGDDMVVTLHDPSQLGEIFFEVPVLDSFDLADTHERIYAGEGALFLVGVFDTGTPAGGASYDLSVEYQDYTDLETIDDENPVEREDVEVAAGTENSYLAWAEPGMTMTITAIGTSDETMWIEHIRRDGSIVSQGSVEREVIVPDEGWVAFRTSEIGFAAATYDLTVTVTPPPYEVTAGALTFTSVCPGDGGDGVLHPLVATGTFPAHDEGISETPVNLPFSFQFFEDAVTEMTISSNGWLTFETGYNGSAAFSNAQIPNQSDPNGIVAPFWDDLHHTEVCVHEEADRVTVQWEGRAFNMGPFVEFQVVVRDDGSIDVLYGPGHEHDSHSATIGIENLDGDAGLQVSYDTAGNADAGTSYTFTPTN